MSWADLCRLSGWSPPPAGIPVDFSGDRMELSYLYEENKIRVQYCEDETRRALDWHAHDPGMAFINQETGERTLATAKFGTPPRRNLEKQLAYGTKPAVAVSWQVLEEICAKLTTARLRWHLPTEAQWEKAARGGLIGALYPWGNRQPYAGNCDFNRIPKTSILPSRCFSPNGYGLCAMSGGVWEWCADWYDAGYYRESERLDPAGPPSGREKVLRGGSWADCADAVTVSFRSSRMSRHWRDGFWSDHLAPNIGARLCLTRAPGNTL